jgi:hypothetical protein
MGLLFVLDYVNTKKIEREGRGGGREGEKRKEREKERKRERK